MFLPLSLQFAFFVLDDAALYVIAFSALLGYISILLKYQLFPSRNEGSLRMSYLLNLLVYKWVLELS